MEQYYEDTTDHAPQPAASVPAHRQANPFGTAVAGPDSAGAKQGQSRELAEMQTKFLMAQHFPRDERKAMDGILNAFSRTSLAEHAQYAFQRGGEDISGLSIDAMEAIAQQWQNIEFGWSELSRGLGVDGVPYSEVRAYAIDLQSRVPRNLQFIVRHWRDTKKGGYRLKDERDIYELCANMAQRRVRSCLEAVIPRDVQESAREQANVTLKATADTSPEAMNKMLEAFAKYGVTKARIEKLIQRRLDAIQAAQVVRLKRIYTSLRDGLSTADEWFEPEDEPTGEVPPPPPAAAASATDRAKDALRSRGKSPAAPAPKAAAFDHERAIERVMAAKDSEILNLMVDEWRDLPDGPDKDLLMTTYRTRMAELAQEGK